jgi:hypothetical protein
VSFQHAHSTTKTIVHYKRPNQSDFEEIDETTRFNTLLNTSIHPSSIYDKPSIYDTPDFDVTYNRTLRKGHLYQKKKSDKNSSAYSKHSYSRRHYNYAFKKRASSPPPLLYDPISPTGLISPPAHTKRSTRTNYQIQRCNNPAADYFYRTQYMQNNNKNRYIHYNATSPNSNVKNINSLYNLCHVPSSGNGINNGEINCSFFERL